VGDTDGLAHGLFLLPSLLVTKKAVGRRLLSAYGFFVLFAGKECRVLPGYLLPDRTASIGPDERHARMELFAHGYEVSSEQVQLSASLAQC